MWERHYGAADGKRTLWIQFRELSLSCIIITKKTGERLKKTMGEDDLHKVVKEILNKEEPFDLCVFDGVRMGIKTCSNIVSELNAYC